MFALYPTAHNYSASIFHSPECPFLGHETHSPLHTLQTQPFRHSLCTADYYPSTAFFQLFNVYASISVGDSADVVVFSSVGVDGTLARSTQPVIGMRIELQVIQVQISYFAPLQLSLQKLFPSPSHLDHPYAVATSHPHITLALHSREQHTPVELWGHCPMPGMNINEGGVV